MVNKKTSAKVAKKASKIMRDDRFSDKSRSVAASGLSQAEGKKGSKKGSSKGTAKKSAKKR